jgi:hypothetical protein
LFIPFIPFSEISGSATLMLHHMGLPARYSVAVPPSAAAASRLPLTAPTALPSFSASAMPLQMYLHGIAQRENMLRNAFADYLKPVCTPDGEILLDVECGENRGLLYLSRFCQGSKGPCIRFDDMWLTPNEFQYISGRESAKDWKRSIRHQGKSLKLLLAKGILTVHQSSCSCTGCRISSPVVSFDEICFFLQTFFNFFHSSVRFFEKLNFFFKFNKKEFFLKFQP